MPRVTVKAPLRISFGGGGTDLAAYYTRFGGLVVSSAITRYCSVTARPATDRSITIVSIDYGIQQRFEPGRLPPVTEPLSLPKAAVEWFHRLGLGDRGVELVLASDVPPGTGLGSSSAMAVALVRALATYLGLHMDVSMVAELASRLEIARLGMPIGKQDQYASAFGGFNAIVFGRDGVEVHPMALSPTTRRALGDRLLLFSTGRRRKSGDILRRQQTDTAADPTVIASLHHLKAIAAAMRGALEAGDLDEFGALLDSSWQIKKGLSTKVSSEEIDGWYAAARSQGALGGKITGAGGGGYLLLYCPPTRQDEVRRTLVALGLREMTFDLAPAGVQVARSIDRRDGQAVPAGSAGRLRRSPMPGRHAHTAATALEGEVMS
jgi:D-glycero-alpha-D-manno-heptose-7-phosphate kinase